MTTVWTCLNPRTAVTSVQTKTLDGQSVTLCSTYTWESNKLPLNCLLWVKSQLQGSIFSSSLRAMNHKNVTNIVWHCFWGLINDCSYSHGGKPHTDRFEDFCLAVERWRKASSCVSWRWTQAGWMICNQAVPLMWTLKFTLQLAAVFLLPLQ